MFQAALIAEHYTCDTPRPPPHNVHEKRIVSNLYFSFPFAMFLWKVSHGFNGGNVAMTTLLNNRKRERQTQSYSHSKSQGVKSIFGHSQR